MSTTEVVRILGSQGPATEEQQGSLKADLQYLRRKGLFKASSEFSYQGRKCVRCGVPFGRFYNTGASCTRCRHKVCRQCRIEVRSATDYKDFEWICNVCYKNTELHGASDKWICDKGSESGKTASPVELLKHNIRRAWTINGPPTRWSATRRSPEFRIYRSLPSRHQKLREVLAENGKISVGQSFQFKEIQLDTASFSNVTDENTFAIGDPFRHEVISKGEKLLPEKSTPRSDSNERTNLKYSEKLINKKDDDVPFADSTILKKQASGSGSKPKSDEQENILGVVSNQEQPSRISLIKPPRILSKFISPDKATPPKYGERKSNIPIFKRSSKEFEDIRSPQESPKRSLIPQRYRGSTDDLRRSREDISVPSMIPKLLSPRNKEERLKRQDSKDDIRLASKCIRKETKDETKSTIGQSSSKDDLRYGIRIFRRDSSREDVGRDNLNSNVSSGPIAAKGKQTVKEEKQERTDDRVGVFTVSKLKLVQNDQDVTKLLGKESKELLDGRSNTSETIDELPTIEPHKTLKSDKNSSQETMLEGVVPVVEPSEDNEIIEKFQANRVHLDIGKKDTINERNQETFDSSVNIEDSMKETSICLEESDEADLPAVGIHEKKHSVDLTPGKRTDDFQVIRRKFSKEEYSNPDDTDDTPNKRCSSHLSPEASPLSTRSSRYSPRESESEPTPALPRKTGDSSSASQRIRDAITRTRRESNSSTRYESSGSESVRLSETGLHGYAELARKVKFFGGTGSGATPSTIGSDEVVQRDSATSAGEDEPHDDSHCRTGPVSSQGRSMLRRRRQFDAQGSRRRGRSHARNCYAEDLQGYQALHVIGHDSRQASPTANQSQDQPIVDYRRLVFISSDSSSGREEDDADSSCSSSSYLNGLPRGSSGHAQSLEDCDWDYFESGTLPLPSGVPLAIGAKNSSTDSGVNQDWSCCPGRGSAACAACGGSRSANVLPVPVPIPVPVPYPVPVPAALWTGDFVAAASSMISRSSDTHTEPGTLRLRGDPAAPWFAWHPRFNQPLHGTRFDPRLAAAFDPTTCSFRPDQVLPSRLYDSTVEASSIASSTEQTLQQQFDHHPSNHDGEESIMSKVVETFQEETTLDLSADAKLNEQTIEDSQAKSEKILVKTEGRSEGDDNASESDAHDDTECQDSLTGSLEKRGKNMYQHSREDSGSSSGRSSADSSDLEEDSSSHRFFRVFVVNDDSLTSDNDIEDNGDEDDSDCAADGGVTLKRVTALPEEDEPVVLQYVTLLNEVTDVEGSNQFDPHDKLAKMNAASQVSSGISVKEDVSHSDVSSSEHQNSKHSEKRKSRGKKSSDDRQSENIAETSLRIHDELEEIYLASDSDCMDNLIELISIKSLDPDGIQMSVNTGNLNETREIIESTFEECAPKAKQNVMSKEQKSEESVIFDTSAESNCNRKSFSDNSDLNIIPDSLEIPDENASSGDKVSIEDSEVNNKSQVSPSSLISDTDIFIDREVIGKKENSKMSIDKSSLSHLLPTSIARRNDKLDYNPMLESNINEFVGLPVNTSSTTDSFTSNDTNTTCSEVSSDELHEYELTSARVSSIQGNTEIVLSKLTDEVLFQLSNDGDGVRQSKTSSINNISQSTPNDEKERDVASGSIGTRNDRNEVSTMNHEIDHSCTKDVANAHTGNDSSLAVAQDDQSVASPRRKSIITEGNLMNKEGMRSGFEPKSGIRDVNDMISSKIEEMFKSTESTAKVENAHVSGESTVLRQVVGEVYIGECEARNEGGSKVDSSSVAGNIFEEGVEGESTRFRSVERRPSTRKENGFLPVVSAKDSARDIQHFPLPASSNNNIGTNNSNKYRSLVMITQEASYQPVSVITSDTTTLLQPDEVHTPGQGLAGYFQLALESVAEHPQRKNRQGPRKPLMVKRLATISTNQTELEADSGLSVGSASESDDVSVKNAAKINRSQENSNDVITKERQVNENWDSARARVSSQSSDDNSGSGGVVILEEGLADDDSWVEEVSHDEDEPGATTATEESSEDEANNLGDREEELRGYHRQAIDFTLHTIVEESCEESEAEPSLTAGSPSKKQRPPSASELEKYFFFGLGGDGNNSSMGSREVDSLSETSSIYSEGLESLGQDEGITNGQNPDRSNSSEGFLNSSRLEKYFLSEFLGFDQDRRDSDGSVGSDSEGRPSPEAQRRKRLVRARGSGRSHSSSLDNLLALTQSSQNLSSQNSLQDLNLNQDGQETESEGSSTETDGTDDGQTPVFGTDGQFDTVKRKKKKPRNLGTQSPRVPDDRNKTPEPPREIVVVGEVMVENEAEIVHSEDSERAKTPQPECVLSSSSSPLTVSNVTSSSHSESARNIQINSGDALQHNQRSKQQSRDSGFVGSCDDLLQHQKIPEDTQSSVDASQEVNKDRPRKENDETIHPKAQASKEECFETEKTNPAKMEHPINPSTIPQVSNPSLSRKDSFNNWSSDEETNLMMSKMRQFFKTMVANSNGQVQNVASTNSGGASPAPSPRLPGYSSKARLCAQNRTKPPQLVYFENELTRLMKTVPGIRDDQVREIVEYLSSEDTWSDSYDSSDYTSSDLEGAAGGRRSALQEQISQSCQQIISKFDTTSSDGLLDKEREDKTGPINMQPACLGRDTAFVYQKLVQSFTKMAGDGVSSDANSTPHSSPPLIAKVMHHIGSRLVALMHEVSEGGPAVPHHSTSWRRYSQHHRTPSSASTTEDDDSTSDSTNTPTSAHLQLPRSKSHDPLLLINSHPTASPGQEGEEREASDYERFSWRGSFESALMATDSRTKLSLLACSGDVGGVGASASASALAMAAKRRSAGDLLFNPKSFSREQLDRVRSCGSIGGGTGGGTGTCGGSIEERIWSNRRRSSVPDANTRGESGASAGDEDTEDELEYPGESRATTLPRGMQSAIEAATNSLPRLPASTVSGLATTNSISSSAMHKAHSVYHFLPQHSSVKSARYRPPGFARNTNVPGAISGPKRAVSAPGLQVSGSQASAGKRDNPRSRRQQAMSLSTDDGNSLSEACSTPIIGAGSRASSSHNVVDVDDMDPGLHSSNLATRASLSSLGARSDSMASVYSGAGEGRCCRSVIVTGEVEFALQYDYKHLTFEVHVTKCKNLAPVDVKRKRSDPYVKVYLLPDKSKSGKRKTKVKKHTLNPEFNETLKFHMSLSGLETRTLWLTVWHSDMFGRNDFLGEVRMPLENKIFDDPTPKWYTLQERTEPFDDPVAYKGEVIVGLKFVPPDPAQQQEREMGSDHRGAAKSRKNWSRGALHVLVKEARNLQTRAKNSGTCDPFCKSYLLPDKGRSGKQKTGVIRRCGGSPVWGHTFIYKDVSLQELAERGLELTVWDHDRIASNEFLGGVRFNLGTGKHYGKSVDWMDATGRELSLWQNMLERPNFWVEGAVTLRPNLHNHGKNSGS